jgi:hypothetical protein
MSSKVKRESATAAHIEMAYLLELSVGASHVASMLYPTSRQKCIEELTRNFLAGHGSTHLGKVCTTRFQSTDFFATGAYQP